MRLPTDEELAGLAKTIVRAIDDAPPCDHPLPWGLPHARLGACLDCREGLVTKLLVGAIYEREHTTPTANCPDGR